MGSLLAFDGARPSDRVTGLIFIATAPIAWWLFWLRPHISLGDRVVTVQNPLRRISVPLGRVVATRAGYSGLLIEVEGRQHPVAAWAVQKMNLSEWLARETRADRVAAEIRAAVGLCLDPDGRQVR